MMRLSKTLSWYMVRHFMTGVLSLLVIVLSVALLLTVVEMLRRASANPDVGTGVVLSLALLKLPDLSQKAIPFVVLFGTMYTLWHLTRRSELITIRASGVSAWQFLAPLVGAALALGILMTTVINPISAVLMAKYQRESNKLFRGQDITFDISKAGLWLRQPYASGHALIHAQSLDAKNLALQPVTVFFFKDQDTYAGRIDADIAFLHNGYWELQEAFINMSGHPLAHQASYSLPTNLTLDRIEESFSSPETLSFWNLPHFISLIKSAGLPSLRHRLHFQVLLVQPLLLCAMVLVAAVFVPHHIRRGKTLIMFVAGMVAGFVLFLSNNIAAALGTAGTIPLVLAAWAPATASFLLGTAALLQKEDG